MTADPSVVVAKKIGATVNPFEVLETLVDYADRWVTEVPTGEDKSR
jgi:hypothetical protein